MPNEERVTFTNQDLMNQWSIIFFYPKDGSPGCTIESCAFRDKHDQIIAAGGKVYGVSQDGVTRHKIFKESHNLQFTLLTDRNGVLSQELELKKTLGLLRSRVTMLVDPNCVIQGTHTSQFNPYGHVKFSIKILKKLVNNV